MIYINNNKEFHLTNGMISYICRVEEKTGVLEQLYFGSAIPHQPTFDYLIEREIRPSNNFKKEDHTSSLEHIKQEMPMYGTTDFRYPAVEVQYPDGDAISHFNYSNYRISNKKRKIPNLPTSFYDEAEAETLTIVLKDRYSSLTIEMDYTIFKDFPIISRQNHIVHHDDCRYQLMRFMSMSLDLPIDDCDWLHLDGAWARETQVKRDKLHSGLQQISSTRGASSHIHNPFFAICEKSATEFQGDVYAFSLIYSGNFVGQIEVDTYRISRVQMGINPYQFSWQLEKGDVFSSPEVIMNYAQNGFNEMSRNFHAFFKKHLIRQKWASKERPVLINNWEATYFNFDESKILALAQEAANLGIELFVLDDGWFGHRDNDASSLGNWQVDKRKLPHGIRSLSQKIHEKGLKFGLWFEPEMVSMDTPLYQAHPDWIVGHPQKNISHGRNQYVLDFSQNCVIDCIFEQMDAVLKACEIDYVKWDMNRYISEAYSVSLGKQRQGEFFHRYILGVYALYEKLLAKYPDLLIESCAGGGGRFDPALLYYAPQTWTSDDTDAIERLKIQYGASMVYPLSAIGSHVSEVPNHQVARMTSLKMRSDVALFGTFGYELDVTKLSQREKSQVKNQIILFKKHRTLLHTGTFFRLQSPFNGNVCAWMVVSENQTEALIGYYQILAEPNPPYQRLRLKGLNADFDYTIWEKEQVRTGKDLMAVGLIFGENYIDRASDFWQRQMAGDFSSKLIYLTRNKMQG